MNHELLDFYRGTGRDARDRSIEDVWNFGMDRLEEVHDYIQWLFPTVTPSRFNPDAPLLDEETIAVFRADEDLQARLRQSLECMLHFYGLELLGIVISRAANYRERQSEWQDPYNHNLLRLTRILDSLHSLCNEPYSRALLTCLESIQEEVPNKIPARTLEHWHKVVPRG